MNDPKNPINPGPVITMGPAEQHARSDTPASALTQWFYTYYHECSTTIQNPENPVSERLTLIEFKRVLDDACKKYVFQEEICPTTGRPHLQGTLTLKNKMTYKNMILLFGKYMWCRKLQKEWGGLRYCTKVRTSTGVAYWKGYPHLDEVEYNGEDIITTLYPWQQRIVDIVSGPIDKRTVNWVWEPTGNVGKSSLVKYMAYHHNAIFVDGGSASDIKNLVFKSLNRKVILLDIPRTKFNRVSYSAIEACKNGMIFNEKYETGSLLFPPPHVVVFANSPPDLTQLSADRWNVIHLDAPPK